jgi:hypothetical protein
VEPHVEVLVVNETIDQTSTVSRADKSGWRHLLSRANQRSRPRYVLLTILFLDFALLMLWPLPLHAGTAVQDLGDPLYEIWTMRWVQHQLASDPAHLWDGNMGYPFADSLLFSEPRLSTSVIAWPVEALTGNDVLAYNVMLIGSYVLVGLAMALLLWEITGELGPAILTGFVAAFVPYRFGHLSHLNLLSYGWGLLSLWLLVRFARRRRIVDAIFSALFLTIQVLASDTLGLMLGIVIAGAMLLLLWQERKRLNVRLVAGLGTILLIPALAELPVALARLHVDRMYGFSRDISTVSDMSATLQTYWSVSPGNPFWRAVQILPSAYPNPLFPGVVASLAAIAGLILGARYWTGWTIYAGAVALFGFVLSLGPLTVVDGHHYHLPYYVLYLHVPGFDAMRDAARFGMLALIGIEILAGLGFAALWRLLRPRLPQTWVALAGVVVVAIILASAAAELKTDVGTAPVPKDHNTTAVYDWLAGQPPAPVMEFPANGLWTKLAWTIREIYYSTRHWDPITAAYTSFIPQQDVDLLVAIHGGTGTASEVNSDNVGILQDLGIHYVVIHRWEGYDWRAALDQATKVPELTRVGQFGDATVFVLSGGHRAPVRYQIEAPRTVNAGQPVVADVVTRNDNANAALGWLHQDPTVGITWRDAAGDLISDRTVPIHLGVTVNPGLAIQPIELTAPTTPGIYQLTIRCSGVGDPLTQTVTVRTYQPERADTSQPSIVLQRLEIAPGPYRAGDDVALSAVWDVRQRPVRDLTATVQLLDNENHPIAQWDGRPFGDNMPTNSWQAGSVIVEPLLVKIPPDLAPSEVRAMIAFYDFSSPTKARETIETPDGRPDTQYVSAPLPITTGTP